MAKQISEFTEAASAPAGSFYLIELADGTYRSIDEANVTGGGDMSISVYDPTAVSGDAFDMDNMVEGATNLILTAAERAVIAAAVTADSVTEFTNKTLNDFSNFIHADAVHVQVRNESGGTLLKGEPVYATGYHVGSDSITVDSADNNDPTKMPAIGLLDGNVLNNANGHIITLGSLSNFDTSAWAVGDFLWVANAPGALTNVRPTAANEEVQKVGEVTRSHATAGRVFVFGASRSNDGPNVSLDSVHRIIDDGDATKLFQWQLSGSTTATTTTLATASTADRTITLPDADVALLGRVGSPASNQIATFTGPNAVEGSGNLTFAGAGYISVNQATTALGAGLDFSNSTDVQSWRLSGDATECKIRDVTGAADVLSLAAGAPDNSLVLDSTGALTVDGETVIDAVKIRNDTLTSGNLSIGSQKGTAGNVILDYPTGGTLQIREAGGAAFAEFDGSNNFGLGTLSPGAKFDVRGDIHGYAGNSVDTFGADDGADGTRTDITNKRMRFGLAHYTNAEEPAALLNATSSTSNTQVYMGGGTSFMNAATILSFYTAANNTTLTGTERMQIGSAGNVEVFAGDLVFNEKADHAFTPAAAHGSLWVRNDTPNVLVFTDDAGTDTVLGAGGGGGDVTKVGTPVNDELAVWTGDGTLEGTADLTYNGTGTLTLTAPFSETSIFDMYSDDIGTNPLVRIYRSRNGGAVTDTSGLGYYEFFGDDGTSYIKSASIAVNVDGTVAASTVPSKMTFSTTDSGGTLNSVLVMNPEGTISIPSGEFVFTERADHVSTPGAGFGYLWVKNTVPSTLIYTDDAGTDFTLGAGGIANVVEDTTPQLGGHLDANAFWIGFDNNTGIRDENTNETLTFGTTASAANFLKISNAAATGSPLIQASGSDTNVGITILGKGTGNVKIGNYEFDTDQTVGAGQDNYVLTYDNGTGLVSLEVAGAGGDVTKVGTPVDNEIGVWTGDGTIEGDTNFTWTGSILTLKNGYSDIWNGSSICRFGANSGSDTLRTNATAKVTRIGIPHWTNAEEPVTMLIGVSDNSANGGEVSLGGGSGSLNAAQLIRFWTAVSSTTLTGTERMRIDSSGNIITYAGDIVMTEKADHGYTPAAGLGQIWVKNDAPSSLIFTDDAGTDFSFGNDTNVGTLERRVDAGITASTTQTQGQGPLTDDINEVATVANANDTVTLPTAVAGRKVMVINNGANTLQIFPASGDDLGAGVNTATTIATTEFAEFTAYDATNWTGVKLTKI
jgi:hypothetical protein